MSNLGAVHRHITWLMLGGALTMGMAACGGKAGGGGGSGGSASVPGDGDGDNSGSSASGDGEGDAGSGGDAGDGDSGSGGDATSTGDGDGDTGSGGNAGDGDGDASGGTGGDNGPNPGVHTLGDSCGSPGDLGCAGENQKLQLLCDGSKWVANGTCAGTAVCDTGEANRGSCQEPIEGCEVPSDEFCDGTELRACGADRLGGERLEGCCGQGQHLTECCPETEKNVFDCSNDCVNKSEECLLGAESMCAYLDEISVSSLPAVVRTPAGDEICPTVQSDGCQEEFFAIYFKDSTRSYRVEMPEGMMAAGGPMFTGQDSWSSPCSAREDGWLNTSGCFTVRPLTEDEAQNPTFSGTGVIVNVPFGAGGRNLKISEGECPE